MALPAAAGGAGYRCCAAAVPQLGTCCTGLSTPAGAAHWHANSPFKGLPQFCCCCKLDGCGLRSAAAGSLAESRLAALQRSCCCCCACCRTELGASWLAGRLAGRACRSSTSDKEWLRPAGSAAAVAGVGTDPEDISAAAAPADAPSPGSETARSCKQRRQCTRSVGWMCVL